MPTTIQIRRSTQGEWNTNSSVVLLAGEAGYETDTGNVKIGDGSTTWANLKYQLPYNTGERTSVLTDTLTIDNANDRVGIGAGSPTEKLSVGGNAAVSGNITAGGTLAVTGNTTLTGDLAVNGGDITTSASTLNVATTTTSTQTVNIATGATANGVTKQVNIGTNGVTGSTTNVELGSAGGGSTFVRGNASVDGTLTVQGSTTLGGATTLGGDLAVNGSTSADITTTTTTASVFNTTATTLNVGQAATALSLGATTGTATIRNTTTNINGSANVGGTLAVVSTTEFTGAPSYAADPASGNVLARKSYVDSQLRVGSVVILTASSRTDFPDNSGGTFTPGIADPGMDTAGIAGKPSSWTASISGTNMSVQASGGTWFGVYMVFDSDGNSALRYAYQNGTDTTVYGIANTGITVILVRTA